MANKTHPQSAEKFASIIISRFWPVVQSNIRDQLTTELRQRFDLELDSLDLGGPPVVSRLEVNEGESTSGATEINMEFSCKNMGISLRYHPWLALNVPFGLELSIVKARGKILICGMNDERVPLFAAISYFLTEMPDITYDFTDAANIADAPIINDIVTDLMTSFVLEKAVYPTRTVTPVDKQISTAPYVNPMSSGLLSVKITSSREIDDADLIGDSDVYYTLKHNNRVFTSKLSQERPFQWTEQVEIFVGDPEFENIRVEMYDQDTASDDELGFVELDLLGIISGDSLTKDSWYKLRNTKSSFIRILFHFTPFWKGQVIDIFPGYLQRRQDRNFKRYLKLWLDSVELSDDMKKQFGEKERKVYLHIREDKIEENGVKLHKYCKEWKDGNFPAGLNCDAMLHELPSEIHIQLIDELSESVLIAWELMTHNLPRDREIGHARIESAVGKVDVLFAVTELREATEEQEVAKPILGTADEFHPPKIQPRGCSCVIM